MFSARQNPQRSHEATPPVLSSPAALLDGLFEHPHLSAWTSEQLLTGMNFTHGRRANYVVDSRPPYRVRFSGVKSGNDRTAQLSWFTRVGLNDKMDTFSPKMRSWIMAQVKSAGNKSTETRMVAVLRKNGITGWRRSYPLLGKPNFTFSESKVVLFVDGCFWHGHPTKCRIPKTNRGYWMKKIARNVARDRLATRTLEQRGWKVVRIWENAIEASSTRTRLRKALA